MQENTPTLFFEINHLNFVFIVGLYDDTQDLKIIEKIITAKEGMDENKFLNIELIENISPILLIFEVACFTKDLYMSFLDIPWPSSITWIKFLPAFFIMILIFDEFASIEFSKSSFRTDDGLWTTSPAAILLETSVGKILIISGINQLGKL